jgi:ACS family hexuronate transporter-like MFS transporter
MLLTLLILAGILNYVDRQLIAVLKPLMQESLNWSDTDYGSLTALFQLAAALAFLSTGWIVDRVGWRAANPLGVGSWSLAAVAHSWAHTFEQFVPVRLALGATESFGTPCAVKTIAESFTASQRSIAFGLMNASGNAGAIITPLVMPAVAFALGWPGAFLVAGTLGFAWVLAWLRFVRNLPAPRPSDETSAQAGRSASMREVFSERRTWAIAGGKVLSDSVWWLLLFWAPDFFHRMFHLTMQGFALPLALIYALAALGSLLGGLISSRLIVAGSPVVEVRKGMMLGCALVALALPAALFVQSYWAAAAILGLTLAAHQGFSVNLFALTADVTPRSSVATTISIGALCGNLAGMGVLRLAGETLNRGAGYGLLFGLAAVAYLLAVAWIHLVLPRTGQEPQTAPA